MNKYPKFDAVCAHAWHRLCEACATHQDRQSRSVQFELIIFELGDSAPLQDAIRGIGRSKGLMRIDDDRVQIALDMGKSALIAKLHHSVERMAKTGPLAERKMNFAAYVERTIASMISDIHNDACTLPLDYDRLCEPSEPADETNMDPNAVAGSLTDSELLHLAQDDARAYSEKLLDYIDGVIPLVRKEEPEIQIAYALSGLRSRDSFPSKVWVSLINQVGEKMSLDSDLINTVAGRASEQPRKMKGFSTSLLSRIVPGVGSDKTLKGHLDRIKASRIALA